MSDVLDIFGEVEKSVLVLSHPLREKGLPFRQMYLTGLVMASVAGGDISEEKKTEIGKIGASLCLSESEIGQTLEMGLKPSKEGLRAVIELLADYPDENLLSAGSSLDSLARRRHRRNRRPDHEQFH